MPQMRKKNLKRARVGAGPARPRDDMALLRTLVVATLIMAFAVVLVPFDVDPVYTSAGPDDVVFVEDSMAGAPSSHKRVAKEQVLKSKAAHDLQSESVLDGQLPAPISQATEVALERKQEREGSPEISYHVVFSTGCSTFQDWQSYVLFYHLLSSGQEGQVTRIASGCSEEDEKVLEDIFAKEIAVMAPGRFHLHFTPDFSLLESGRKFKYMNKPCGMRHWLQEGLGFPDKHADNDDTIVILLDPDQVLIRPFTNDFTHSSEHWRLINGYKLKVEHGSPFAQQYGFGIQWKRKVNLQNVFEGDTPVANMTDNEARDYYTGMGPPYVATAKDMYTIVTTWADIVPRVHIDYPHLLAEMFGYNLAAAHHGLRHTIARSFMVSDVFAGGEGFKLIDAVPDKDICHHFPVHEYPHVIHYCQRYFIGKWFIGKYKLRKDFLSCDAPLLTVPPKDLASKYTSAILPDGKETVKELQPKIAKEEAFMVCAMIQKLNQAAVYYKDHQCDKETANYDYSYTFHDDMTMPEDNLD